MISLSFLNLAGDVMFSSFLPNSNRELIDPRKKIQPPQSIPPRPLLLKAEGAHRGGLQRSGERGLRAGQAATAGTCSRWALGPGAAAAGSCAREPEPQAQHQPGELQRPEVGLGSDINGTGGECKSIRTTWCGGCGGVDAPSRVPGREWVRVGVPEEGWACFAVFLLHGLSKMLQIKSQTGAAAAARTESEVVCSGSLALALTRRVPGPRVRFPLRVLLPSLPRHPLSYADWSPSPLRSLRQLRGTPPGSRTHPFANHRPHSIDR
ncbi:uncharacterized protein LOC123652537 [Pipistrellus kuhlii]|uniref:uncharacterized protein LOC123652537 n=1 Tax=Pipistrellus kuhlii TaxID=59472 RepID=UPI001E273AD2|nr:uncharacterized protein LOC123652537 [Pipistrellus kuhlii]